MQPSGCYCGDIRGDNYTRLLEASEISQRCELRVDRAGTSGQGEWLRASPDEVNYLERTKQGGTFALHITGMVNQYARHQTRQHV